MELAIISYYVTTAHPNVVTSQHQHVPAESNVETKPVREVMVATLIFYAQYMGRTQR